MLELIALIAAIVICIMIPIEVGKIRRGWVRKKFEGNRPKFLAAYRAQLKYLTWVGLIFGGLGIVMALLQDNRAEIVVKLVVAAIWFTVAGISFFSLRSLADVPDAGPAAGSGA